MITATQVTELPAGTAPLHVCGLQQPGRAEKPTSTCFVFTAPQGLGDCPPAERARPQALLLLGVLGVRAAAHHRLGGVGPWARMGAEGKWGPHSRLTTWRDWLWNFIYAPVHLLLLPGQAQEVPASMSQFYHQEAEVRG